MLAISGAPSAVAEGTTTECADFVGCVVTAEKGPAGKPSRGGSPSSECRIGASEVPCKDATGSFDQSSGCYLQTAQRAPLDGPVLAQYKAFGGSIQYATCPFGGAGGYIWQPPAKPVVTAAAVRAQAIRLVPTAAIGVAPKNVSLVNVETVLWADAPPRQTLPSVTLLGQRVVITLELNSISWRFGDGQTDGAAPAGKAYDARNDPCKSRQCDQYYGHTYRRTGEVTISATANWRATFKVDGGAAQNAGDVPGPSAATNLIVKQARGVLVPNPGETP